MRDEDKIPIGDLKRIDLTKIDPIRIGENYYAMLPKSPMDTENNTGRIYVLENQVLLLKHRLRTLELTVHGGIIVFIGACLALTLIKLMVQW